MKNLLLAIATVAAASLTASESSAQSAPWEDVGYVHPSSNTSTMIDVSGHPLPGSSFDVAFTGGPPNGTAIVYFGPLTYGQHSGATLVPSSGRSTVVSLDGNGEFDLVLVWPSSLSAGTRYAIQADTRASDSSLIRTNAVVGTTLTTEESAAYSVALMAESRWQTVSFVSLETAMTVRSSPASANTAADLMTDDSYFPSADGSTLNAVTLVGGLASTSERNTLWGNFRALVETNDTLVKVNWSGSSAGSFHSYMLFDASANEIETDTFGSMMPETWPFAPFLAQPEGPTNVYWSEVDMGSYGLFGGLQFRIQATPAFDCQNGTVVDCRLNIDASSPGATWGAQAGSKNCNSSGGCCYCTLTFAYVSGFKSISVDGIGGFTVAGNIGVGESGERAMRGCCD